MNLPKIFGFGRAQLISGRVRAYPPAHRENAKTAATGIDRE